MSAVRSVLTPRGSGRLILALVAAVAAHEYGFTRAIAGSVRLFGGWGIVPALVGCGFLLAVLFTTVCDGPRAVAQLARRLGSDPDAARRLSGR